MYGVVLIVTAAAQSTAAAAEAADTVRGVVSATSAMAPEKSDAPPAAARAK